MPNPPTTPSETTAYTIKPLEWEKRGSITWRSVTPVGRILVCKCSGETGAYWWECPSADKGDDLIDYPTLDAAKAAAEAWYRERLMSALEPVQHAALRAAAEAALRYVKASPLVRVTSTRPGESISQADVLAALTAALAEDGR